ncbi:hypothetical protein I3843_02G021800 [Carya illinoinensis]|nr:hypothetical protein I3843_02G021800 [Carya illinoinensis]
MMPSSRQYPLELILCLPRNSSVISSTFELRIEQNNLALEATVGSVHIATKDGSRGRGGKNNFQRFPQQNTYQYNPSRGRGRGYRGRGGPSSSNSRPSCQVCGKTGHTAIQCYHRFDQAYQGNPPNMAAYLTSQQPTQDLSWYPDTGSTNHLTHDLQNLNIHAKPYNGSDQIQVGDGTGRNVEEGAAARQV